MIPPGLLHPNGSATRTIAQKLQGLAREFAGPEFHLSALLKDPQRFSKLSLGTDGFFMDNSCQRLTAETLEALYELSRSTGAYDRFCDMTRGAMVNTTEHRAALHTAARGTGPSDLDAGDLKVHEDITAEKKKIKDFCDRIHGKSLTAKGGQPFTCAVVVGIGGSYLGCEFVYQAMGATLPPRIPLHFLPNVDIDEFAGVTSGLQPETTLWIVISKSFTTTETMANLAQVRAWFKRHNLSPEDHLVTITAKGSPGDSGKTGVMETFHMFDFIGGRYSVSSAVGGLPLSLAYGYEAFERFLAGCRQMDEHTLSQEKSLPMTAACISVWNTHFLNYPAQGLIPYSSRLSKLPAHIQQLHMESLGKSAAADGTALKTPAGMIIFGEPGTNAQHSFFQLAHQGPGFPMDFIGVISPGFTGEQALSKGVTNHQELWANLLAQTRALALGRDNRDPARRFDGNRPSSLIMIDDLAPERIGMLLAFYEARTVLEGFILGVNPFDQFGVELGKVMAGDIRREMAARNENPDYDFSSSDPALKFYLDNLYPQ